MTFSSHDMHYMRSALALSLTGLGHVAPNPSVGCVIVKGGIVLARARTGQGGRPHAETEALEQAGPAARGATAYVTLEPCAHHGQTGPCAQALAKAGVARVVIACGDPDPRVAGKGIQILKEAGVQVDEGLCRDEAEKINKGFFLRITNNRPLVSLKIASTLDAKVASAAGHSKWITGAAARAAGHLERSQHDAVAIGINTVLADDPQLTTRLPGVDHGAVRIVFDRTLRFPPNARLLEDAYHAPVWVICAPGADSATRSALEYKNINVIEANDLAAGLKVCAQKGLTRIMVEGGPTLITAFLKAGLYDRLLWFRAASVLGAGRDGVGDMGIEELDAQIRLTLESRRSLGQDILEIYNRAE